ncbi:hypothetical protein C8R43DRAFT_954779 [Mycena crocata]|nr:hypothetical protein C8R43DRAFT_954779 [Mycena crocata]
MGIVIISITGSLARHEYWALELCRHPLPLGKCSAAIYTASPAQQEFPKIITCSNYSFSALKSRYQNYGVIIQVLLQALQIQNHGRAISADSAPGLSHGQDLRLWGNSSIGEWTTEPGTRNRIPSTIPTNLERRRRPAARDLLRRVKSRDELASLCADPVVSSMGSEGVPIDVKLSGSRLAGAAQPIHPQKRETCSKRPPGGSDTQDKTLSLTTPQPYVRRVILSQRAIEKMTSHVGLRCLCGGAQREQLQMRGQAGRERGEASGALLTHPIRDTWPSSGVEATQADARTWPIAAFRATRNLPKAATIVKQALLRGAKVQNLKGPEKEAIRNGKGEGWASH